MATNLYLLEDQASLTPTAGTKAGSLPKATNGNAANSSVEGSIATFWGGNSNIVNRTVNTTGTAVNQSYYFGRFSSKPLQAQTIAAQTWNWRLILGEGSNSANTYLWPVMYVWRPSNNTVVGYVFNASAQAGSEIAATAGTATRNNTGSAVTCAAGDILVVELWMAGTPTAAVFTQTARLADTGSYIASTNDILFQGTFLYPQDIAATVYPTTGTKASNLPKAINNNTASSSVTDGQLTLTSAHTTPNRSVPSQATTSQQSHYLGRFSTAPLKAQTIPAQNWSWELSTGERDANANVYHWPVLYVWRPSTNSVVGYVFNASANFGVEWRVNDDPLLSQQFAGASVTTQAGDILVLEVWGVATQGAAASYSINFWADAKNSLIYSPYDLQFKGNDLVETLVENFDAALDTGKWTATVSNGTAEFTGGEEVLTVNNGNSGTSAGIDSVQYFDYRDSSVYIKLVQAPRFVGDLAGQDFTVLNLQSAGAVNRIGFSIDSDGNFRIVKYTNGTWAQVAQIAANYFTVADTHTWMRIREQSGTTYFDTAPIGASNPPASGDWVNRHSVATNTLPITPSAVRVNNWIYCTNVASGAPVQPAKLDGLNTNANILGPVGTLSLTEAADTISATATVVWPVITATLTRTEATDVISSGATQSSPTGNLTRTEAQDTISSTATVAWVPVTATLAITEATDTIAAAATVANQLASNFTENFNAPIDTGKWTVTQVNGTVNFSGGTGNFNATPGPANRSAIVSVPNLDFRGQRVFHKLVQPLKLTGNTTTECAFTIEGPPTNRLDWVVYSNGHLSIVKFTNNVWGNVKGDITTDIWANLATYQWLAFREAGGIIYFETAPATASNPPIETDWVVQHSITVASQPVNLASAKIVWQYYSNTAVGTSIQDHKIDGLNTAASVLEVFGTAAVSEAPDTVAASATVPPLSESTSNLDRAEAPDTISSSASSPIGATFARTEAVDTIASTASSPVGASAALIEATDVIASGATSPATGNLTLTEGPDTVSAAAVVVPFPVIGANLIVTEAPDTLSSVSGFQGAIADSAISESSDTVSSTASTSVGATLTRAEASDVISASAGVRAGGSLTRSEAADSIAASASSGIIAALVKAEFDDTLSSIAKSVIGASLAVGEARDTISSAAVAVTEAFATLTRTEAPDTLAATATVTIVPSFATLNVTEKPDTILSYTHHAKKRVILVT